jgi:hypothetical protein
MIVSSQGAVFLTQTQQVSSSVAGAFVTQTAAPAVKRAAAILVGL